MRRFIIALFVLTLLLSACAPATAVPQPTTMPATAVPPTEVPPTLAPTAVPAPANPNLILATTTSTQDSGLLDVLVPMFEAQTGYTVQTVAVGSGQAMQMGTDCNADVLLVHSPSAEVAFMDAGSGKEREDPAAIKGLSAADAFKAIAAAGDAGKAVFVARADKSGTSTKELGIWKAAGIDPAATKPAWYLETGQGMGASLTIASEKGAYTLADRATYLANKDAYQLDILAEGEKALLNIYHVITVNPEKCAKNNYEGAVAFQDFMVSPETQAVIGQFGLEKFGQPLFTPDAGKDETKLP
jgi:tungstate transport system substrate-binding protein